MNYPTLPGWKLHPDKFPKPKKKGRPKKPKQKKKRGAPRKKRKFEETPVGFLIMHEAPLEFQLIKEAIGEHVPHPDFIERIGYASLNPLFRKPKFRRALKTYREFGIYSGVPKKTSPKIQLFYIKLRKNQKCEMI